MKFGATGAPLGEQYEDRLQLVEATAAVLD
jgi:hypothetical protein